MNMKVILLKEMPKLGKAGEVRQVADGYARNFLIPFGYAEAASESSLKGLASKQAEISARIAREQSQFQKLAEKLAQTPLGFTLKVGEKGRAFGSITAHDIADELNRQGAAVEKGWIELEQGIKTTGEHTVAIRFPNQAEAKINIIVEAEDSTQQVKRVKYIK